MAKSKKQKQSAPNIAFIERIEIQIKEKARQRMLKRAPKPAGQQSTDILNQQYLLQRTLAQRIQPLQQSQSVNIYLGDLNKLQQQETLKRIDEDANAAIIRQQRGGINQEALNFVLASLLEQKREVKNAPPPKPVAADYGFVKEGAVEYKEEQRSQSISALQRLNKGSGPRSVAFESISLLPPDPSRISESSTRRRALTPEQKRSLSVEAGQRASALSKMTAQEFVQKHPDLTGQILNESMEVARAKYQRRRKEIESDILEGRLTKQDGESLLRDFSIGIGLDIKPRFKAPTKAAEQIDRPGLTTEQEQQFPKTAAALKKKSQTSAADISAAIASNVKPTPTLLSEQVPAATGGGQVQVIEAAKISAKSGRQRAATIVDPRQQTILQSFGRTATAAEDLSREVGASSPIEPTPPSSRPTSAAAGSRPRTGESFTRPGIEIVETGKLPRLNQ